MIIFSYIKYKIIPIDGWHNSAIEIAKEKLKCTTKVSNIIPIDYL